MHAEIAVPRSAELRPGRSIAVCIHDLEAPLVVAGCKATSCYGCEGAGVFEGRLNDAVRGASEGFGDSPDFDAKPDAITIRIGYPCLEADCRVSRGSSLADGGAGSGDLDG